MPSNEIPRRSSSRQLRQHRLRVRVVSLAVAMFLAAWLAIGVQMASSSAKHAVATVTRSARATTVSTPTTTTNAAATTTSAPATTTTTSGSQASSSGQTAQSTANAPTAVTTHQS
jgi:hypothetical protein